MRRNIHAVQMLRGLAALIVVIYHVFPQMERMGYAGPKVEALSAGVDIFFVISGFIMWHTMCLKPERGALQFYRDRAVRILPLYWVITLGIVGMMLTAPSLLQTLKFDPAHVVRSFLFLPEVNPGDGTVTPVLVVGWTLNYEVFFYLVFGAMMALTSSLHLRFFGITAILGALVLSRPLLSGTIPEFYTNSVILEFALGMTLAALFSQIREVVWGWAVVAAGFVLLFANPPDHPAYLRVVSYGFPSALIVLGALMLPSSFRLRAVEYLGDASYSLYLSHFVVMSAAGQLWRRIEGPVWGFPLFGVAACVVGGLLCYHLLEKPLAALFRKRKADLPLAASA